MAPDSYCLSLHVVPVRGIPNTRTFMSEFASLLSMAAEFGSAPSETGEIWYDPFRSWADRSLEAICELFGSVQKARAMERQM